MSEIWVDTDFGFDDLWAMLLLRHLGVRIAGLSLVAGNVPLTQVVSNALGAQQAYGLEAPIFKGADRPLVRPLETAERILGPRGMLSRGQHLPDVAGKQDFPDADKGFQQWLHAARPKDKRDILAIGPLTNIARLISAAPDLARKITRLIWMGGSNGPGNHSAEAEFNALADPEAAAIVAQAGLNLDVIDLTLCRQVRFGTDDLPKCDDLTSDLLGGYLDIGLSRGNTSMAIYDPVAALASHQTEAFAFMPCAMSVSVVSDESYGKTLFEKDSSGSTRLAVGTNVEIARICLTALAGKETHVD
ncbi:nucleoside hydrolase [Pararhizobium sp. IMCC21322]|uniref:nucleoside hydrolase n=1 Tax=Pararhizobium sp. IMCC21322 TaxID=3067903 RepID=UPI0027421080|nr:nucleoside hydrolase [Pararhizobium sp. IMCC21322]